MNELGLFAGIGGGLLGTKLLGWRTVCYVEWEKYCIEVLRARIKEGYLDDAPIWDDVSTFDGKSWRGVVDVITAGFPCTPFSVAGKQKGEADDRNKWPDTIRIIREVRPTYVFLENVPNLLANPYIHTIFRELAESGYDCQWDCIRASDVGAPHKRERLWIVGHSQELQFNGRDNQPEESRTQICELGNSGCAGNMAVSNTINGRRRELLQQEQERRSSIKTNIGCDGKIQPMADTTSAKARRVLKQELPTYAGAGCQWWRTDPADAPDAIESQMGRVADGLPDRIQRLKGLGNAQVPAVVAAAWRLLTE